MQDIMIFRRVEKKYRISPAQKEALLRVIGDRLAPDAHGRNTICSLYLDTPDFLLIRNSITARTYKEKLRLRSYGIVSPDDVVFLEIKKKYKGVVYKRRISTPLIKAMHYLATGEKPEESQIMSEIDYARHYYRGLAPAMFIAYEREAYFVPDVPCLRLTFDTNVRYRRDELCLDLGSHGISILPDDAILLEVKTDGAMPLWLSHALAECGILPGSFSKYGTAYQQELLAGHTPFIVPAASFPASPAIVKGDVPFHA